MKTIPMKRTVAKSDGSGNTYLVPDPDFYDEDGNFSKHRKKATNFTPKKKKRK